MDTNPFYGITGLVVVVSGLIALFRVINGQWKSAVQWGFAALVFEFLPYALSTWISTGTSAGTLQYDFSQSVGPWFGGTNCSAIISNCANMGADYGTRIWAALSAVQLPQAGLLWLGIRAYLAYTVSNDFRPLLSFFIMGSLIIPRIVGGPGAFFPTAVINASASLMQTIIGNMNNPNIPQSGFTLSDLVIARNSARLPGDLRNAIVAFDEMAKYQNAHPNTRPPILTTLGLVSYAGFPITYNGIYGGLTAGWQYPGPDLYPTIISMQPYIQTVTDANSVPTKVWTATIRADTIWAALSDGQGKLRDASALGYNFTQVPMGGTVDPLILQGAINSVYSLYNLSVSKSAASEIQSVITSELSASGYNVDLTTIQAQVQAAVAKNAVQVTPPQVIRYPSAYATMHASLQQALSAYYQEKSASPLYQQWKTSPWTVPNILYDPDFYGCLVLGSGITIPLNQQDVNYSVAQSLAQPGSFDNYMTAGGIASDVASGPLRADNGSLGDSGTLMSLLLGASAWLGMKVLVVLIKCAVPIVTTVVPYICGLFFLFLLASYPVFAITALFPNRWMVLLDWCKAVVWVMSWAVCYQIGMGWINNPPPVTLTADVNSASTGITQNIFTLLGMLLIVGAPAFTSFVLTASTSALQNIGGTLMSFGFKVMGAAAMIGGVTMVAVTAGTAIVAGAAVGAAAGVGAGTAAVAAKAAAAGASGAAGGAKAAGAASSAAASGGSMLSRFGAGMKQVGQAVQMARNVGSNAAGTFDALYGSGIGHGAGAVGPLGTGGRTGSGSKGGGAPGGGSAAGAPNAVTIARNGVGQFSAAPATASDSPGAGTARAAQAHDAAMMSSGESPSRRDLAKAEMLHGQAATFAAAGGDTTRAAVSASYAAEAAVATGSKGASARIGGAERAVGGALAGGGDNEQLASAHMSGARTQMAKAQYLTGTGDAQGAQVATGAAAVHLQQAARASTGALRDAGTDGSGSLRQVTALAGIGGAAQTLQTGASGATAQVLSGVSAQVTAALSTHGTSGGGASSSAAQGYMAVMAGDGRAAAPHFQSASQQSSGSESKAMESAAKSSAASLPISVIVSQVAAGMGQGQGISVNPYIHVNQVSTPTRS